VERVLESPNTNLSTFEDTHHLVEHKFVRLVGHINQRVPPLARDLVEATAWEPFWDVAEEGEEVDCEETGGEEDVELIRRLVGDADQFVVLGLGPVTVGYPKDDDAHRPKEYQNQSINTAQSASREIRRTCGPGRQSPWARPTSGGASARIPPLGSPGTYRR